MIQLSIIIVNFNTSNFLEKSLNSIYQNIGNLSNEIIVIDNASTEKSKIKSPYPAGRQEKSKILFINNKKNVGFAAANNQGIKRARGKYILFLNPDTLISSNVLPKLVDFMGKNPKVGVVTCRVRLESGKLDDACHRGFPTPWNAFCQFSGLSSIFPQSRLLNGYHLGYKDLDKVHEIDACAGAFMLIKKEAGEMVKWLDEDYFWYGEDLDFCYRIKQAGWKIMFVPDMTITHYKSVSGGIKKHSQHLTTADRETKLLASRARFDVMRIFYKKHYQSVYPVWLTWLVLSGIKVKEYLNLFKYRI